MLRNLCSISLLLTLLLFTACGSSKNSTKGGGGAFVDDIYDNKKIEIPVNKPKTPSVGHNLPEKSRSGNDITVKDKATIEKKLGLRMSSSDDTRLYSHVATWVGTPYRAGGNSKKGTDCSGFVTSVYKQYYKKTLQRSSADIYSVNCVKIPKTNLKEGDLVFFKTGRSGRINHVGIYLKDNKFIHSSSSKGVIVNSLNESYYRTTWAGAGRVKK